MHDRPLRIAIDIDDKLLAEAQRVAGTNNTRATVHHPLQELVRRKARRSVHELPHG